MTDQIATHEPPGDADFLIRADLAERGMPGRGEQLWARRTGPATFVLRSVPFFVYGFALDDEVETDDELILRRVVRPSGRRVLRVAAEIPAAEQVHGEVHPLLEQMELAHEWHALGYVAIDVGPEAELGPLMELLDRHAAEGLLFYEWA